MEDEITETLPWTARFAVGDWVIVADDFGRVLSVDNTTERLTIGWECAGEVREHTFLENAEVFITKAAAKAEFETAHLNDFV
jgi:hypothetical protein